MKLVPFFAIVCLLLITQLPQHKASSSSSVEYGEWSRWSNCDETCHQTKVRTCLSGTCQRDRLMKQRKCPGCGTKLHIVQKLLSFLGFGGDSEEIDYDADDTDEYWSSPEPVPTPREMPEIDVSDLGFNSLFSDFFNVGWDNPFSMKPINPPSWDQERDIERDSHEEDDVEEVPVVSTGTNDDVDIYNEESPCGVTSSERSQGMMAKIIGGRSAKRGRWPWQVALYNPDHEKFFCGGTLIGKSWVITAAHCLLSDFGDSYVIFVGLHDTDDPLMPSSNIHIVEQSVIHPRYDSESNDNDIALLKLQDEVKLNADVGLACLPDYLQASPDRSEVCKILGWGGGTYRTALQEADMNIQSMRSCRKHYYGTGQVITNHMICASSKNYMSDTCGGDSGGPLLCRNLKSSSRPWTLFGITSFGDDCRVSESPGVYTRVSSYRKWIDSIIACGGSCDA
ncbi:chymotrypsin-like elastase family member 2A [Lutzomyia longipalpis]|uniref:chymotrypsin-like elastase family member 2A n=1 Tax=Lutzomyia longipalpis TaxID=7200 RepID=UPI0024841FAF|nr:chymotrypsin-like elastase family member 2A [Lutzomyia longipalpis]